MLNGRWLARLFRLERSTRLALAFQLNLSKQGSRREAGDNTVFGTVESSSLVFRPPSPATHQTVRPTLHVRR